MIPQAELDWERLFPDSDFRHPMALRPGNAAAFFAMKSATTPILKERMHWADSDDSALYVAAETDALNAIEEFAESIKTEHDIFWAEWDAFTLSFVLTTLFEPDWAILRADSSGEYRLIAGGVCFPSGWSLPEKMGKPICEIHSIVPGLNDALGRQINVFLSKLDPKAAWERENWGLSADTELNHHPALKWKRLDAGATLEKSWIRLERQVLFKLPRTGAIVFGIRLSHHRVSELAEKPDAARRMARALETMSDEMAVYKGIGAARAALIAQLKSKATEAADS